MTKLYERVRKYRKRKETERHLISAFESEIKTYIDIYKEIYELSETQILPIYNSIGPEFNPHTMNELLEAMSDLPLIYVDMINAFIRFAKACSEVSALKGLMEDLKDTDIVLHDFIITMKNAYVEENKVKIDGKYYRFFKTYEDEIFREVEIHEVKTLVESLKRYVRKTKHYVEKTPFIKRRIRKKYRKNFGVLAKATKNMIVEPATTTELRAYIPEKLLPITVLIDELS